MRILGVDTASDRKDRGYAIVDDDRRIIWTGAKPPPREVGPVDLVAGERPWQATPGTQVGTWGKGGRRPAAKVKLTGERLITFAVNNGFQLRDAWPWAPESPPRFVLIPVLVWKDLLFPGCSRMQGDAFCANIRQRFAPAEQNHNVLDAIGIAIAAARLDEAGRKKHAPKGFLR